MSKKRKTARYKFRTHFKKRTPQSKGAKRNKFITEFHNKIAQCPSP